MSHKRLQHRHNGHIGLAVAKLALEIGGALIKKRIADRESKHSSPPPYKLKEPIQNNGSSLKRRR